MIQINNKLRIVKNDEKNLAIEELRTITSEKKGSHEEWCWCGYYGSLKSALLGVLDKLLFDSAEEELDIQGLIKKIEIVEQEILSKEF